MKLGAAQRLLTGLSIAWATGLNVYTTRLVVGLCFATHYHEMARLETPLAHLGTVSMTAREYKGELIFLHEAKPGAADRSFGVQVAKLAGMPAPVIAAGA